jgi:hypothetical protein
MKREDDEKLWDLLGHAAEPKISPFFARNVLRETRKLAGWGNLREWLSVRRLLPAASLAVALIAVLFLRMQTPLVPLADPESDIFANVDPQDYEVVADLNELLASDDNNSLEDSVFL